MIAIIDYDAGNLKSVEKALHYLGQETVITRDPEVILKADKAVLPGVGSFGDAMGNLHRFHLVDVIKDFAATGKPFLGICLGLQLLFEESEETPGVAGLGFLKGKIHRIPDDNGQRKVPHIGWNNIEFQKEIPLFKGLEQDPYVYFVHSYYLKAENREDVAATTSYGVNIDCAVFHGNINATQFHPEKSSKVGLQILDNFINMTGEEK